ncbi:hypothetical protein WJX77_005073 [Trebouxia sp. C0004]
MASVMKLCGNFFISSVTETTAEGMTLAEKNGVSRTLFWISSVAHSLDNYIPCGLKDVGLIQSLAKECGVQMPLGELMLDQLKEAGDRGWTDLDWTAVTRVIRE